MSPSRAFSRPAGHGRLWLTITAAAAAGIFWAVEGQSLVRRRLGAPRATPQRLRTESRYLALLFPRITRKPQRLAMSARELDKLLGAVQNDGGATIGLAELQDFHRGRRRLPRGAVLLAFADDRPESVRLADAVLRRRRMRGLLFISQVAAGGRPAERRYLSRHALRLLRESGSWDFGVPVPGPDPADLSGLSRPGAELQQDERLILPAGDAGRLRFVASETSYNDGLTSPKRLQIMRIRTDRSSAQTLGVIRASWPRRETFRDDFKTALKSDWVPVQGIVASGSGRLALLPTPRHTGAGAYLRGTERWRDVALDFELQRYARSAWVYARFKEDGSYVRAGARNGSWVVEQKSGPREPPNVLGSVDMTPGALPATVRFIVKGTWVILQVNGRMLFGRAIHINPRIDYGRVQFSSYDPARRTAAAALGRLRANPGGRDWLLVDAHLGDDLLPAVRDHAARAYALSPLKITVEADGRLTPERDDGGLSAALAGFYRCRLVPAVDFRAPAAALLRPGSRAEVMLRGLDEAARLEGGGGLNLRLNGSQPRDRGCLRTLRRLRASLHARGCGLWLTLDDRPAPEIAAAADGVLIPAGATIPGLGLYRSLEFAPAAAPRNGARP
ncbi:MAG: hypothetical protein PHF00_00585 [Elusimicrobia bacterium]|nr:hypothetical protein [Elusimicrobiota bacterium]